MLHTRLFNSSQEPCLGLDSPQIFQACYLQGDLWASMSYICHWIYMYEIQLYHVQYDLCTHVHCVRGVSDFAHCFTWQYRCRPCSVLFPQTDPKQKTIYDLFQKTFSESRDDADDILFLEAADAGCEFDSGSALQDREAETCSVSPKKKRRIEEV